MELALKVRALLSPLADQMTSKIVAELGKKVNVALHIASLQSTYLEFVFLRITVRTERKLFFSFSLKCPSIGHLSVGHQTVESVKNINILTIF